MAPYYAIESQPDYDDGGVEDAKALLHAKKWYVYVNEK